MAYTYWLPDRDGGRIEHGTTTNSVVIIGANGSGKTRLGVWMEKDDFSNVHRIGAQRSLEFGTYIQQMSYEQATNNLMTGSDNRDDDHDRRWKWDGEQFNYASALLKDYEAVLSATWAKQIKQVNEYVQQCREKDASKQPHGTVPEMVLDVLNRIWSSVFPHRDIHFSDGKVTALFASGGNAVEYRGRDMSDGERVALYLICQALSVPQNKTIIVDEPEIHLHRSIMNRLWSAIEKERQDCLFIYITHDTQFAANHSQSQKIWVKSFDGTNWDIVKVEDAGLPDQLLLDIMGNRRKVLFVEGTNDSFDTRLYAQLFNDYYVVPCGSCSKVIEQTKAMRSTPQLHDLECYGLIDRDYRCEAELVSLRASGIYSIGVAEVENLFVVSELLEVVNELQGFTDQTKVEKAKTHIANEFAADLSRQIRSATIADIKYRLSVLDVSGEDDESIQSRVSNFFQNFNYDEVKHPIEEQFAAAKDTGDYKSILALYNRKSLKNSVGQHFGLANRDYCEYILRQLNGSNQESIKRALNPYLPAEIPH